jgi:hypothetical protein
MGTFRRAASIILCALLLLAGIAAECLALAKFTVLNPAFYGRSESAAYGLAGRIVVRRMAEAVLENAPAIALQTTNRERAYELAAEALPPEAVAEILESSGPDVAAYFLRGGDLPVLRDSDHLQEYITNVVKNLMMDDLASKIPEAPTYPDLIPFTPEWNAAYADTLAGALALPRYYAGLTGYVLAAAVALAALLAGVLYLIWIKDRKPFFILTGSLLAFNGLLLMALAAAVSYGCGAMAEDAASSAAFSGAASFLASDWPALFRAVLWPFRQIFFVAAVASLSLGAALFGCSVTRPEAPAEGLWNYKPRHRRTKPTAAEPADAGGLIELVETESNGKKSGGPKHGRKN